VGTAPGEAEINGTNVRWHFAPIENQTHTFQLTYTALGVLRKSPGADTILWRALPPDRAYEIDNAEITLHYPPGISTPQIQIGPAQQMAWQGDGSTAHLAEVPPHRDVRLEARFAPGQFAAPVPQWIIARSLHHSQFYRGLAWSAIPALLILFGSAWWGMGTLSKWHGSPASNAPAQTRPPDNLAPALAGRLSGRGASAQAVLLELARRGVITVEQQTGGFHSGYLLRLLQDAATSAPHEQEVIQAAFRDQDSVKLVCFQQRVQLSGAKFRRAVTHALKDAGLFDPERLAMRSHLRKTSGLLGTATLIAAVAALLFLLVNMTAVAIAAMIGLSLAVCTVTVAIAGGNLSPLSEQGQYAEQRWEAFRRYLLEVGKGQLEWPTAKDWDHYLPYAAAFGVLQSLLRRARRTNALLVPAWFNGLTAGSDDTAYLAFLSTSIYGSADGGAGAGAAASGGGSSGAG
jgi:hypothetical protein